MEQDEPAGGGNKPCPTPLRAGWLERPSPARFDPDRADHGEALAAHRVAVERGSMGYADPRTGLFVMTAPYLRDRGWCCDRGCRHCPYTGAEIESEPQEDE